MSEREWIVENTWVCTSCQSPNRGRDMKCCNCGNTKDKDEKDVVPDGDAAPVVTDTKLLELANQGEDWVCEYCGARVRDANGKCQNCAAGKEEPKPASTLRVSSKRIEAPPIPDTHLSLKAALALTVAIMALICGAIFGIRALCNKTDIVTAQVAATNWTIYETLNIKTQKHQAGAWGTDTTAFNVSCERRYYGDESCNPYDCNAHSVSYSCRPHDCNGHSVSYSCHCHSYSCGCHTSCTSRNNGFSSCHQSCSTCSSCSTCYRTEYSTCYDTCHRTEYDTCYHKCPVYKQWCSYDYFEWVPTKSDSSTGTDPWNMHGPYLCVGASCGDPQRIRVDRSTEMVVRFQFKYPRERDVHSWLYRPQTEQEFRYFVAGHRWKVAINGRDIRPIQEVP